MEPESDALAGLIRGFDGDWWTGLPDAQRDESLELLASLVAVREAEPVNLTSPVEGDVAYSMDGWPQPNGSNAQAAASAWAARGVVLTKALADQPGVRDLLVDAACGRVEISWPRGDSLDPGEALQLANWIAACLEAPGSSVQVRLGGWPTRGWTLDEMNQAKFLANRDDPAVLLRYGDAESPRILELSLLASALRQPLVAGLAVEVAVVQPPGDFQDSSLPDERAVQATSRALEIVGMLRSAVGDGVSFRGTGRVGNDVTAIFGVTSSTPEQQATLDALDRRLDVAISRPFSASLEEEELPGDPSEGEPADAPEDELPDEPTDAPEDELPGEPTEGTPADDAELPGDPQ